jgi:RNA polymerase sigma-70 factor, ECF subfamily
MDLFAFDDDYVRRLREGDRWTENHFVEYFELLLTLKLRGRVRPTTDIPDIVQEVFVRVYAGLRGENGVRDGRKLGAYVFQVCNHVMHERVRADRQTEEISEEIPAPDDDEAFRRIVSEETKARVHRTLDALGKRDADVLRALFLHELEKDEVCRRFGVDRNYLRVLVHRALEKFRDKYDDS